MAHQEYGPTPPRLLSYKDGSLLPTSPDAGTMKTFDSEKIGLAVFYDSATHDLAETKILSDRCVEVVVYAEAMDPSAGRVASGGARLQIARIGAAPPTIVGTPVMLTYTPAGPPPWVFPTVSADLVVSGPDSIAVRVRAFSGVRWRASVRVIGAQAQQIT